MRRKFPKYVVDSIALVKFKIDVDWGGCDTDSSTDYETYLSEYRDSIEVIDPPEVQDILTRKNAKYLSKYRFLANKKLEWATTVMSLLAEDRFNEYNDFVIELLQMGFLEIVPNENINEAFIKPTDKFFQMIEYVLNIFVQDINTTIQSFPLPVQESVIEWVLIQNEECEYIHKKLVLAFK